MKQTGTTTLSNESFFSIKKSTFFQNLNYTVEWQNCTYLLDNVHFWLENGPKKKIGRDVGTGLQINMNKKCSTKLDAQFWLQRAWVETDLSLVGRRLSASRETEGSLISQTTVNTRLASCILETCRWIKIELELLLATLFVLKHQSNQGQYTNYHVRFSFAW